MQKQQADTRRCPAMGRGPLFWTFPSRFLRGPLPESGLFLKSGAWKENGKSHPQSLPVSLKRSKAAFFPFSRKSAGPQPVLRRGFTHEISVQMGVLPALCGVSSQAGFHQPRYLLGERRKHKFGVKRSGGWGVLRGVVLRPDGAVSARSAPACRTG